MKRMQKKKTPSSSSFKDLPTEILFEICSKLPLQSILSCKCVCKSFSFLGLDSKFATLQSGRAPEEFLIVQDRDSSTDMVLTEFRASDDRGIKPHFNIAFSLPKFNVLRDNSVDFGARIPISVINCCRGLICLMGLSKCFAVIWNPLVGEFTTVCSPTLDDTATFYNYGFGYCEKSSTFKLLRMFSGSSPGALNKQDLAQVLTFEEEGVGWRYIQNCPNHPEGAVPRPMVYVGGAVHWLSSSHEIISFDFGSEQFRNVELPTQLYNFESCNIGVFEGCLCLILYTWKSVHVWVMKEYGLRESWNREFCLTRERRTFFQLLKYLNSDEVSILNNNGYMIACNTTNDKSRNMGRLPTKAVESVTYTPSLLRLRDALKTNHYYSLNVHLRPVLKICRSLLKCDIADPKKCWSLHKEDLWKQVFSVGTELDLVDSVYQFKWDFSNLERAFQEDGKLHGQKVYLFGCTEPKLVPVNGLNQIVIIPVVVAVVSPFPPSDKIGINSVQREAEEIVPMKQMKRDWVRYIPIQDRDSQVEQPKSCIFILSCTQRRAALKHLKIDRVKKYEYYLPYFYRPFKEDDTEQNTLVQIIYPAEPKPVICEFDWDMDTLEDFANDLIKEEELTEDQKDAFKEFVKDKVREAKKANREVREARKKAIEEMSEKNKAAFEAMKFYKFYPVPSPDTPDVSNVKSPFINRYYGKAHEVM